MAIAITLGLHNGRISGIFITGIFGNFYTKRGEFLTFRMGIPGGLEFKLVCSSNLLIYYLHKFQFNTVYE